MTATVDILGNLPALMRRMSWDIVTILLMMLLRATQMHTGILIENEKIHSMRTLNSQISCTFATENKTSGL